MPNDFTVHCIPWVDGALLLQDVRETASELGLLDHAKTHPDKYDEQSRHAIALSKSGHAIGCARISAAGRIERITVLPHENMTQIGVAMIEVLLDDYVQQSESRNKATA